MADKIECRSKDGLTIGLLDSIIYISRVLDGRDFSDLNVKEAIDDLNQDPSFIKLLKILEDHK